MENNTSKGRLTDQELKTKLLERKWLLGQRNRMGYGLSLGAMLLFFGIGGGQNMLLLVGGIAVAVGLYFLIHFEKQRRELEQELKKLFPDGIPEKLPSRKEGE